MARSMRNSLRSTYRSSASAFSAAADENAKNEADNTEKMLDKWYGVKVEGRAEFKVGDKDFTPQILKMKQLNPDIVLAIGQTPEVSIIIRQMRDLGLKTPIYGGAAAVDNRLSSMPAFPPKVIWAAG